VTETRAARPILARLAVYLAATWLLAWALMKLFKGNPMELPGPVRAWSPFDAELTFRVAIAIELSIVSLVVVRPRWGWLPMAGLYAFFVALLVPMVASGAESCGCGGGAIKMPPLLMLSIDGLLLVGLLATRPWRVLAGTGLPLWTLALGLVTSWASPWLVIRSATDLEGPLTTEAIEKGGIRYFNLEPAKWKGQAIYDVAELTRWIAVEKLPIEGSIVFWRQGCDHCAQHLRELATKDDRSRQFLLVQVRDDLKDARAVDAMPQGGHVQTFEFPEGLQGMFTTPFEVVVVGGVVKDVLYEEDFHPPTEGG
jgi:hypothetical protein